MSLLSGFTLLSVLHFLEVGSFGKLDLEKLSFECLFQVAETHSNSHMHLNTFLPFVYAVSMVSATHMENAENKNRVKLSHLQLLNKTWKQMEGWEKTRKEQRRLSWLYSL